MAKLNIYINEQDGKTLSKFGKAKDNEKIVFNNLHASATLEVSIQSEPGKGIALCKPGGQPVESFQVLAAEKYKAYSICSDYQGATFKYTAQVGTATPEDPIIIIERSTISGISVSLTTTIAGAAGAFILGVVVAAIWQRRRAAAPG